MDTSTRSLGSGTGSGLSSDALAGKDFGSTRALNDFTTNNNFDSQKQTIMDAYSQRTSKAQDAAAAGRAGITSDYAEQTRDATQDEQKNIVNETEGQRGFATNLTAVREITNTGDRRIRDLNRARDQLILQNKADEANRIDKLISDEQTAITAARTNWVNSLISIGGEKRSEAAAPVNIAQTQAQTAGTQATTEQTKVETSKVRALLGALGYGSGDGAGGSRSLSGNKEEGDAQDLANGITSPADMKARYEGLGELGAAQYLKLVQRAKQINPSFSETGSNINFAGKKEAALNQNSGNPITSIFSNTKNALFNAPANTGSVWDFLNPNKSLGTTANSTNAGLKAGTKGTTKSGVNYVIIK